MSLEKKLAKRILRRKLRVRKKCNFLGKRQENRLRISVFRSLSHIYAQAIDDSKGLTVASASSKADSVQGVKTEQASQVGKLLGTRISSFQDYSVFFDRGSYKYHGRVKAVAEGLREAGIKV